MSRALLPGIGVFVAALNCGCSAWLREAPAAPAGVPTVIFDGRTLEGWRPLGDARFEVADGAILGEVGGGAQSFLITEREFGDFVLEVELKCELPGNSGIQVRSHLRDSGQVYGYQIEIDPSERAWSGGLYDEARRGWLDDLADKDAARAAFRPGDWNRYRIECRGAWIRSWVNGVPAADHLDALDLSGFIGLQVHSGDNTRVRWRELELVDFGTRAWEPLAIEDGRVVADLRGDGSALRFDLRADEDHPGRVDFHYRVGHAWRRVLVEQGASQGPWPKVRRVHLLGQGPRRSILIDGSTLDADLPAEEDLHPGPLRLSAGAGLELLEAAVLGAPRHAR